MNEPTYDELYARYHPFPGTDENVSHRHVIEEVWKSLLALEKGDFEELELR